MKNNRVMLILIVVAFGLLLSACTGATSTNSYAGALLTESTVYFADAGSVYALKAENGNISWQYPEKASATRLFFAEPALVDEQLIVGDYANKLTSLSIRDGSENWQFTEAKGRYIDSPLIINDTIIAPNADFNIYALNLTGAEKWVFTAGHAFWARPASDGTNVFAPSMDHYLYAINLTNGTQVWKTDLAASLVSRPLYDNGVIFQGNLVGNFFAVSAADGKILWEQKVNDGVWSEPVLHDGKLYFGDQSGNINILSAIDGKILSTVQTDSSVLGSGALLGEGIAFGNENGELILVGFDGSKIWTRSFDGKLYSNLHVLGDRLIVITTQGEKPLIALDANGNEKWYFSVKK